MLEEGHLDQYVNAELLAESGMAFLYRAVDSTTGKAVVLKIPYLKLESDPSFHERFVREEAIGKKLEHPGIVRMLEPLAKSRVYLVMEHAPGPTLRQLLDEQKQLSLTEAIDIAEQIADALCYLHDNGIVHRDLKPENIIVQPSGRVTLIDFGLALDQVARRITWAGMSPAFGTLNYLAPERIEGHRGDGRTDVYALGVILFEMLTGQLPYPAGEIEEVSRAKLRTSPKRPRDFLPTIDPRAEEIVLRAIAPKPESRYPSAKAMLEDLRNPSKVVPTERVLLPPASRFGGRALRRNVAGALAVVLLAAFIVWGALATTPRRSSTGAPPSAAGSRTATP